jgi:hypothetical protein
MRVVNRTAVSVVGAEPYLAWMRARDADFNRGQMTVARARPYGSVILLPETDLEEDLLEWIEDNYAWIFETQLSSWTEDESTWPSNRDLKLFKSWFRIDIHSVVMDAADDDIEGQEL